MDQLKKILAGAIKHQFWIITGVAALFACVAWFLTSSSLHKQYTESANNIDQKFKAMQTVSSAVSTHPNDHSITEMSKIINQLADDVQAAWSLQYKRQEQYLQWREEAIKMPILINKLKKLYPIELKATYPEEPKNPTISNEEKRRFSKYFAEQMPELAKIIGVTWVGEASNVPSAGGMGGMGMGGMGMGGEGGEGGDGGMGGMGMGGMGMGGMGMGGMGGYGGGMSLPLGVQSNDVVIWPKSSQSQLLTSLRMWQGDQPTVFQMMYTQENMWILEGLFNIIAKTNLVPQTGKPATANFQATIKEIEFIRIGRDAVASAGSIAGVAGIGGGGDPNSMYGPGYGSGMMGGESESGEGGSEGGGMGEGGESSVGAVSTAFRDPADGRYVDAAYKPITGDELRAKITSQNAEDAYFAVAKRVPVRLKFKIDYSQLQRFLANCGNEGLMLEVRQVRVGNFKDSAVGGFGGGGMGMGGGRLGGPGLGGMGGESGMGEGSYGGEGGDGGMGGEGMMGGMGMGGMGMGGMGMGGGPGSMGGMGMGGAGIMKKSDELTVEVYGVVYLFNPANIESLGLSKVTAETELKDTVSTPAAEEPTVPAVDPKAANNNAAGNNAAGNTNGVGNPNAAGNPNAPVNPNAAGGSNGAGDPNAAGGVGNDSTGATPAAPTGSAGGGSAGGDPAASPPGTNQGN